MEKQNKSKAPKTLNALVILFGVIALVGLLSFAITPGAFERIEVDGRTIIDPDSFHNIEAKKLSFLDFFRPIPHGLIAASPVVFLILLVGGTIDIYNKSGAVDIAMSNIVKKCGNKGGTIVIIAVMIFFAMLGGFLGWIEAIMPFVPLIMPVLISLGYDPLVGIAACVLSNMLGFAIGPTNILTVGIGHEIAELPMFSGLSYRLIIFVIFEVLSMYYVLKYANKVKNDPSQSLMKGIDISDLNYDFEVTDKKATPRQKLTLVVIAITFISVIYGMLKLGWNINDMTAIFTMSGILVGIVSGMSANEIAESFLKGAKDNAPGAMIVGTARGVQWIMEEGQIVDSIIFMLSKPLSLLPTWLSAFGIFIVVTILNFFVPSGSAKAMAVLPLMIPLGDIIGITRQTAILAYQLGDGLSNMFWITSGALLIFLNLGKVPYDRWIKFLKPLVLQLLILCFVFLVVAVKINYGPF